MGLGAGLIAGGTPYIDRYRWIQCHSLAERQTMIEGLAAGIVSLHLTNKMDWRAAAGLAFGGEILHMISWSFTSLTPMKRPCSW
ncbi:hypothetical protein [Maridesulfovibrio sp.]|uniref:hypothetical protein n=1 Tax=Maridesulfovibrio sp. TaxID=2795000 RepID=UPI0039EEED2F